MFVQAASIDKKNPVVMAAESIIWDIDNELARRESAKRAVQRVRFDDSSVYTFQ